MLLVPLFALSACHNSDTENSTSVGTTYSQQTDFDTLRVTGVYDISYKAMYRKFLRRVNKQGHEIDASFYVHEKPMTNVAYVERGDTIIMQGDKFIKNLTQEKLKNEFVKGH